MATIVVSGDNGTTAIIQTATPANISVNGSLQGPQGIAGPQGPAGAQGVQGVPGSKWYESPGAPSTTHSDGDLYLNTTTGDVYQQSSGAWGSPVGNIQGPAGPTGAQGSVIHTGSGAPSTLYNNGDLYINTTTGDVYQQVSNSWGSPIMNITGATGATGPTGPTGANGANGTPGSVWYEGAGAPSTTHNNGDYYLNTTNGDVYTQVSGSWGSPVGNIQGPPGVGTGDMLKSTYDPAGVNTQLAADSLVVHKSGTETITGAKTFNTKILQAAGGGGIVAQGLSQPSAPTITNVGTAGSTTYSYNIVAIDSAGNKTQVGSSGRTITGNATLNSTNYNTVSWTAVPGAVAYDVLRNATQSLATNISATSFNDQGGSLSAYTILDNTTSVVATDNITSIGNSYALNIKPAVSSQDVSIQSGGESSSGAGNAGAVRLTGGQGLGSVYITGGGAGGNVQLVGGYGNPSYSGGKITIAGGGDQAVSGVTPGDVDIYGGNGTGINNDGGSVYIYGGSNNGTGTAGDVIIGNPGRVAIQPNGSSFNAYLLPSITANRNYTFPDVTGNVMVDSATQTITNKNLTSGTNTFPTFNQNTTGSAATLTTARTIQTSLSSTSSASFNGSANITPGVTGTLAVAHGGTGATTLTGIIIGNGTSAMTAVTAPSGTIVGTTDTQTLTNKTISASSNTISNIGASNIDFTTFDVYSTSETSTGRLWVDGRTIYRKVLRGTVNVTSGLVAVAHGISGLTSAWELVRSSNAIKLSNSTNSGTQESITYHEASGNFIQGSHMDTTNYNFYSSFAWGNSWYTIILEYVK